MNENEPIEETTDQPPGDTADDAPSDVGRDTVTSIETAIEERDANYDRFLRAQAELDNFRRRVQKERTEDARYASARLARDLLPVLDNLERAIDAAGNTEDVAGLVEGVRMVAKQLHDVLDGHAVKPIDTTGAAFDPNLHEALTQVPSPDHPPMGIVQEVERGWTLHDRVLRPAKVVVSSGPPEASSDDSSNQPSGE